MENEYLVMNKHKTIKLTLFTFFQILFVIYFIGCSSKESSNVQCIRTISHNIKSIELSSEPDDFAFLKKILLDDSVKIVMLGEQTHMDGTTFIAKSKLIKFLHEQCGFDVLAFESGFYDCSKAWDLIQIDHKYASEMTSAIFGFWTSAKEFKPLVDYLQNTLNTEHPVILSGIDPALTGYGSQMFLIEDIDNYNILDNNQIKQFIELIKSLAYNKQNDSNTELDSIKLNDDIQLLDIIFNKIENHLFESELKKEFWKHVIEGMKIALKSVYNIKNSNNSFEGSPQSNNRDIQMAENLIWLSQKKYPDKKIIVWAANFHIMRNFSEIDFPDSMSKLTSNTVTMSDKIYKYIGNKMFSITFTDYKNYLNSSASNDAIEYSFEQANYEYAFINLRDTLNKCLTDKFVTRIDGHIELKGKWRNVTDGIFYIQKINKSNLGSNSLF